MIRPRPLVAASPWRAASRRLPTILALLGLAVAPSAQAKQGSEALYVIVHIDIVSARVEQGEALLRQFGAESRRDDGAVRFDVLQEATRRNHFTIVEVWQNQQQLEAHEAAEHTRQF